MQTLTVNTKEKKEVIDITKTIEDNLDIENGIVHIFLTHTTAALTTADLDPGGTDQDMLDAFREIVPDLNYRHPHNPEHVPDHILSALIGTSLSVPIQKGGLYVGTWQHIVLVEFDGPRKRNIVLHTYEDGSA